LAANRSRTAQWRRCLQQICERNGALEIAVARDDDQDARWDLVWRVRVLDLSEREIIIEAPTTLGQEISLKEGLALVAVMSVGQNRWMFNTRVLSKVMHALNDKQKIRALRLAMPQHVQRCQRRNFYRIETAALNLPEVELWPLLDPASVVVAERTNELQLQAERAGGNAPLSPEAYSIDEEHLMPEVGPRFTGHLMNLGGGGVGVQVDQQQAQQLNNHKLFWTRLNLPPELQTPICATAKLVHTHMQSDHSVYAGMAFDFSFNTGHQRVVVDQICRYIAVQQRNQLQRQAVVEERRIA